MSSPGTSLGVSTWSSTICSMRSSSASGSLYPSPEKILMPLNSALLWEAEIITPASALYLPTRKATAGVGTTPSTITSAPVEHSPAVRDIISISEEMRVSMPTANTGRRRLPPDSTVAAARPIFIASSQVSFSLATPRTPSVPNSLPIISFPPLSAGPPARRFCGWSVPAPRPARSWWGIPCCPGPGWCPD